MACSTTNTLQNNKEATSNSPNNANDSITPLVDKRADRSDLSELFSGTPGQCQNALHTAGC